MLYRFQCVSSSFKHELSLYSPRFPTTPTPFSPIHSPPTHPHLEERCEESRRILSKYPDRVPVIVEKGERASAIPDIDKRKFLVPPDLSLGQFVYIVRKRLKLDPASNVYLLIGNTLPSHASMMTELYKEKQDEDGFLYVTYSGETAFGARQ